MPYGPCAGVLLELVHLQGFVLVQLHQFVVDFREGPLVLLGFLFLLLLILVHLLLS